MQTDKDIVEIPCHERILVWIYSEVSERNENFALTNSISTHITFLKYNGVIIILSFMVTPTSQFFLHTVSRMIAQKINLIMQLLSWTIGRIQTKFLNMYTRGHSAWHLSIHPASCFPPKGDLLISQTLLFSLI